MFRGFLALCAVAAMAAPAWAGSMYDFTLDPAKSKITISATTSASSPLAGTLSLDLGAPGGVVNTRDWDVAIAFDTLTARNTQAMSFVFGGLYLVSVPVDGFGLVDFNETTAPTATLAGGPNISTGSLNTEVRKDIHATVFGSPYDDTDWEDGITWNIEVADADWLGVAGTGDVETHISGLAVDTSNGITYDIQLWGRGAIVPEPASLSLLVLGGLAVLRRRR